MSNKKYQLWLFDVWGNARDGYETNNWHKALVSNDGTIFNVSPVIVEIGDNDSNYQINRKLKLRGVQWDNWGDDDINGEFKNGKPFGFLRPIE